MAKSSLKLKLFLINSLIAKETDIVRYQDVYGRVK